MTRLSGGRAAAEHRERRPRGAGERPRAGSTRVTSVSRSAGRARWRSLAARSGSCVRCRRRAGRPRRWDRNEHHRHAVAERPGCSRVRTETGTMATSGSAGSSPCSMEPVAQRAAEIATITSLTVKPNAFLIALTGRARAGRRRSAGAARCAVEAGARRAGGRARARRVGRARHGAWRPASTSAEAARPRACADGGTRAGAERPGSRPQRAQRLPRKARDAAGEHARAALGCRVRPARLRRGGTSRPSGAGSRARSGSRPRMPSTAAWWIFGQHRRRGRPARPWIRSSFPQRRARSSGREMMRATVLGELCRRRPAARQLADVEVEVEVGVLDPVRVGRARAGR